MQHVIKYLLVLAVLMSGFYMARKFRLPESADTDVETPSEAPLADLPPLDEEVHRPAASDPLPVAALVDVDKTRVSVADDLAEFSPRKPNHHIEANPRTGMLGGQPTVRKPKRRGGQAQRGSSIDAPNGEHQQYAGTAYHSNRTSQRHDTEDDRTAQRRRWTDSDAESDPWSDDEPVEQYGSPWRADRGDTEDDSSPEFASAYGPGLEPLEKSSQPHTHPVASKPHSNHYGWEDARDQSSQADQLRHHRIVEGDTLKRLAQRYLGARDRYLDLYKANQDVLFDPRLLPIGVDIVIPDRSDTNLARQDDRSEGSSDDLTARADPWEDAAETESDDAKRFTDNSL